MSVDLRSLIGRLSPTCRRALEGAAGLCLSRTNYEVELEHWLAKLMDSVDGDLPRIIRHFDLNPDRFLRDLARALEHYKTGNSRRPDLSPTIEQLAREGWVLCSINYGLSKVRSGALLLAALQDARLRRRLIDIHGEIQNINVEALEKELISIVEGSPEDSEVSGISEATGRELAQPGTPAADSRTPALDQYCVDLTRSARDGKIDPVLGRDPEIRQIVDILTRRRQNNPILTGEAGVGKTAVVEGFALRIAGDDVPDVLKNVSLRSLDLGLLQAGAGVKGEFENRLKQVIEEVRSSAQPIILFIDEAHTMIGAGGQEGQNDAANLLKPALARGELRTVAATTWAEYKKYFEKDAALSRRFQVVKVEEPLETAGIEMMRGLTGMLEAHHGVRILDEAVIESVRLSSRYIPARQLPDKSVSVLDTACARVAIGQNSTPAAIEDRHRTIENLDREDRILSREEAVGTDHAERLAGVREQRERVAGELAELEERWEKEKELVQSIQEVQRKLSGEPAPNAKAEEAAEPAPGEEAAEETAEPAEAGAATDAPLSPEETAQLREELDAKRAELKAMQGEEPLVLGEVDGQAVAEVISGWTGIPIGKMVADQIRTVLNLQDILEERVLGQSHALEGISRRIRTARAQLDNPSRPVGVFMLAGPSGVGKTESGMALAEAFYGGEQNAIVINMSEYQEAHTVSSLKGSPPGYVGYGEGGVLTEAVRRRPYSIVLLDEVEKAHPDVMELFFQVFDKGTLEDGEGRVIDFKNTIILLTTNVGSDTLMGLCADPETRPEPEGLVEAIRPELLAQFPAALLGRLVVIPFYPISEEVLRKIIVLQLSRITNRFRENHGAEFAYGDDIIDAVASRCTEAESGARAVDHILTHSLLPQMSAEVLSRMADGEPFSRIEVTANESGEFDFAVT